MHAGRPPIGTDHVEGLRGTPDCKLRLKAILETLAGERTIPDACERLGIHSSRFHTMRHEALQAALDRLVPRTGGKGRIQEPETTRQLQRETEELRRQLVVARTEVEVARAKASLGVRRRRRR